ncbi:hypothetical protein ACIO14_25635 [Nocardia fluminea]|uniref:hypothetical protein n=1 Tax=Nocardia fluminea TaxID=134984 RepID=UPI0037FBCFE1
MRVDRHRSRDRSSVEELDAAFGQSVTSPRGAEPPSIEPEQLRGTECDPAELGVRTGSTATLPTLVQIGKKTHLPAD